MIDQVIGEQFIIFGDVDIPASTENTMNLLLSLGENGYFPNMVQEISLADGRSQNRLSLTNMKDINITFNSDRITFARNKIENGAVVRPFKELVSESFLALSKKFDLKINRAVLVIETMFPELTADKMNSICKTFLNRGSEKMPFEWSSRTSTMIEENGQKTMEVLEIGRAQGYTQTGAIQKQFDTIKLKIEVGTDMFDKLIKLSLPEVSVLANHLDERISVSYKEIERICHEA